MRSRSRWTTLSIVAAACMVACQAGTPMDAAADAGWSHYGPAEGGMTAGHHGSTVALGAIGGDETDVVVEGTITDVCQKKGCWMRVADGADELFVRFKDYGFFVPMNATGRRVAFHGTAEAKVVPVDELRHYAEDAGKSPEEIARITAPETRVTFYADSVYIEGTDLDPPYAEDG